jgi:hypothetical protein
MQFHPTFVAPRSAPLSGIARSICKNQGLQQDAARLTELIKSADIQTEWAAARPGQVQVANGRVRETSGVKLE